MTDRLREHDRVILLTEMEQLPPGAVGTIVHVHDGGAAYEVEFVRSHTRSAVVTLEERQVRLLPTP